MSLGLENYKINAIGNIDNLSDDIVATSGFNEFCKEPYNIKEYSLYEIIHDTELIIHRCSGFNLNFFDLLRDYFRVALKCGVNLQKLFDIYIGKNVLNKFRQDHGYKDGTYKKIWNGVEDNVVMNEILQSGVNSVDEIYSKLEICYKNIK